MSAGGDRDFFISYTGVDEAWAAWIDGVLRAARFSTLLQAKDIRPGSDFVHEMQLSVESAERTIAVLSPDYFGSRFGEAEWRVAFAKDPSGELGVLVPVRVEPCEPPGLLATRVYADLVGVDETTARRRLLDAVAASPPRAAGESAPYPGPRRGAAAASAGSSGRRTASRWPGEGAEPAGDGREGGDAPAEPGTWAYLEQRRPSMRTLLGPGAHLLGHGRLRHQVLHQLEQPRAAALLLLSGPTGSGKSAVVDWIEHQAPGRVIDVRAQRPDPDEALDPDDDSIFALVESVQSAAARAGSSAVLVYDDADRDLSEQDIVRFVRAVVSQTDFALVLVCTTSPLTGLFSLPVTHHALDRRRLEREELDVVLDRVLTSSGAQAGAFSESLRDSLFRLSEATTDFSAVMYVIEMLVAQHRFTKRVTRPPVLRRLLEADVSRTHSLPAVRLKEGRLSFRRWDKSELLGQLLLIHLPEPAALVARAQHGLPDFDRTSFLESAQQASPHAYRDAVMGLCLLHPPRALVTGLLTDDELERELEGRRLAAPTRTGQAERADVLIGSLGFTLIEPPVGLQALRSAVSATRLYFRDPELNDKPEKIRAGARAVIDHVESALRDLLQFWAAYLFDNLAELVRMHNAERPGEQVSSRRLQADEIVRLLRFVNVKAEQDGSPYQLSFPESGPPVSAQFLADCDAFREARLAFSGTAEVDPLEAVEPSAEGLRQVVQTASSLLTRATETTYPTSMRITEIVIDEYSRKIFRGVNSEGEVIRFALTEEEREDLVVADHYYMLPQRSVNVNPQIVPAARLASGVRFERAKGYAAASEVQRRQGERLLEGLSLTGAERVLDVGCGTGRMAVALSRSVAHVTGIDLSAAMVHRARREAAKAEVSNVSFEVSDLLEYEAEPFDLVVSNSSMHWILPEEGAYRRLYDLLSSGGRLAVHQGGQGTYRGLHQVAVSLAEEMGYSQYLHNWRYPAYYPSAEDYRALLERVRFEDVEVTDVEYDGRDIPHFVLGFAEAGLLPYLYRLPESQRDSFRREFLATADVDSLDGYSHRLYATARRP